MNEDWVDYNTEMFDYSDEDKIQDLIDQANDIPLSQNQPSTSQSGDVELTTYGKRSYI
jgi:hypothetical protein